MLTLSWSRSVAACADIAIADCSAARAPTSGAIPPRGTRNGAMGDADAGALGRVGPADGRYRRLQFGRGGDGVAARRRRPPDRQGRHVGGGHGEGIDSAGSATRRPSPRACAPRPPPAARSPPSCRPTSGRACAAGTACTRCPSYDRVTGVYCCTTARRTSTRPASSRRSSWPRCCAGTRRPDAALIVGEERGHADDHPVRQRRGDRPVGRTGDGQPPGLPQPGGHGRDPARPGRRVGAHPGHRARRDAAAEAADRAEPGPRRLLALLPARPDGPGDQLGGVGRHGRHPVRRHLARQERLAAGRHRLAHQQHRHVLRARRGLHDRGAVR